MKNMSSGIESNSLNLTIGRLQLKNHIDTYYKSGRLLPTFNLSRLNIKHKLPKFNLHVGALVEKKNCKKKSV
jgi:hypothetical protein